MPSYTASHLLPPLKVIRETQWRERSEELRHLIAESTDRHELKSLIAAKNAVDALIARM